jgi:pyridoxamine 5'-phosphate oxidase
MALVPQDLRIDYGRGFLTEADAAADPFAQFDRWFADANAAGVPEANAMTLATADAAGVPSARIVLLKAVDDAAAGADRGFCFFTNYLSRKGRELDANPRAALCFYWQPLERQVRVEGPVARVSRAESEAYFNTRPVSARVGAWASAQSTVLAGRDELERREAELAEGFGPDGPVPLPDFWGGYRVIPTAVEFWQGRPSRLHDRLRYARQPGGRWAVDRLSP